MKILPYTDDLEIEGIPGYPGAQVDNDAEFDGDLAPLGNGLWDEYSRLLLDEDIERELAVRLPDGLVTLHLKSTATVKDVLEQLPAIDVCCLEGPPDDGPCSCASYAFVIADEASYADATATIEALAEAVRRDLQEVRGLVAGRS